MSDDAARGDPVEGDLGGVRGAEDAPPPLLPTFGEVASKAAGAFYVPLPDGRPEPPGERTPLGFLRDNLEAIAFALVLALLLRHFAIEVFKIPTSSMVPTLFGDDSPAHPDTPGDRILVDKAAYLFHDPARWDVLVFRYPLNWNRNFIKRTIGLPNEALRIERGDAWVGPWVEGKEPTLHPARKPRRVREQLYVPIYPPTGARAKDRPSDFWREDGPATGRFVPESHARFVHAGDPPLTGDGAGPVSTLVYGYPIRDVDRSGDDPRVSQTDWFLVPDVRVRCVVETTGSSEVEIGWSPGDGRVQALRIAGGDRPRSEVKTSRTTFPLGRTLVPRRPVSLELESVDGDVRAWVDGEEVRVLSDEIPLAEAVRLDGAGSGEVHQRLTISVRGDALEIRDVRVDHDLHYTNWRTGGGNRLPRQGEAFHVGPGEYFMLGDNTRSSSDSRAWAAEGVRLKDGREIRWDWQGRWQYVTEGGRTWKQVEDVEGVLRRWSAEDEESSEPLIRMPVVTRDRVIGRAWFALIFWPLDRAAERVRVVH